jgi:hypothetical protein
MWKGWCVNRFTRRTIRRQLLASTRRKDLFCQRFHRIDGKDSRGHIVTTFAGQHMRALTCPHYESFSASAFKGRA